MSNLSNLKKKVRRFKKERKVKIIERKDLEEQLTKFKDIIGVQLTLAKDRMDRRAR
jgi:hypothetical protein